MRNNLYTKRNLRTSLGDACFSHLSAVLYTFLEFIFDLKASGIYYVSLRNLSWEASDSSIFENFVGGRGF